MANSWICVTLLTTRSKSGDGSTRSSKPSKIRGDIGDAIQLKIPEAISLCSLARLQAQLAEQEARRQEILRAVAAQETSKNSMNEETRRLNAKIGLITGSLIYTSLV